MTLGGRAMTSPLRCRTCAAEFAEPEALRSHLAEAHGYVRVGAQVFQRKVCSFCDKPALYRVGGRGLCAEHKISLPSVPPKYVARQEARSAERMETERERDRATKKHSSAARTRSFGRRG